ncbi:MAG: nucleotidyltransferase domain-containing protein [Bacteroidota bacterium]
MISINSHLRNLASELFISYRSVERSQINTSVETIISRLYSYFGDQVQNIELFGSYSRDTILPRKYDSRSDVDILIVFDTESYTERAVSTYRNYLSNFANHWYSSSVSKKDFPTIVLELQRIKFDLVPAIEKYNFWGEAQLFIPDNSYGWMKTDPFSFSEELREANTTFNSIVKPIVRLLKYWNCSAADYAFPSFILEQIIAEMDFSGDDLQSGFFYAIEEMPYPDNYKDYKVDSLRSNAERVLDYLAIYDRKRAMSWLSRILPN